MSNAKPLLLVLGGVGALGVLALAAAGGGSPVQGAQRAGDLVTGQLGRFFTWVELTRSAAATRLGLDNRPPPEAQEALRQLVAQVLDPLRAALDLQVHINSGYRSPAVNQAVRGSATSQHMKGEAVDIRVDGVTAVALATAIVRLGVPFDQVIWYAPERGGHVHVSFTTKRANRRQTLHAPAGGGYTPWMPRGVQTISTRTT